MVAPYNYSLGVPSPTESFLGGVQAAQQFRLNRLQAEAQQAKLDEIARAKQFTIDVAEAKKDPSGEALNALYDKYPEYGSELKTASDRMDAADKKTYSLFLNRAISAKQRGASSDEIAAIYTEGAATAKNSGRNDIAEKFEAAAIMAKNPAADDDFAARSLLNQFDPEGYKVLYTNQKEPFIISNGVAFLSAPLRKLGADTEKLMNGTMTSEQYNEIYGPGKAEKYIKTGTVDVVPTIPNIRTKDEFDKLPPGTEYIAPDGTTRRKPINGGQTAQPSGSFKGSNIDPIRDLGKLGFTPTSGFRTLKHQESLVRQGLTRTKVGQHPKGNALDFIPPRGMSTQEALAIVRRMYPGVKAIPSNSGSIHLTFPGWGKAPDVSGSRRRYGE